MVDWMEMLVWWLVASKVVCLAVTLVIWSVFVMVDWSGFVKVALLAVAMVAERADH